MGPKDLCHLLAKDSMPVSMLAAAERMQERKEGHASCDPQPRLPSSPLLDECSLIVTNTSCLSLLLLKPFLK